MADVVTGPADQPVVAILADEAVVARPGPNLVGLATRQDAIIATAGHDEVAPRSREVHPPGRPFVHSTHPLPTIRRGA